MQTKLSQLFIILAFVSWPLAGQEFSGHGADLKEEDPFSTVVSDYSIVLTNTSGQGVAGACGIFLYLDEETGDRRETRWMQNFSGPFLSPQHTLQPGEDWTFGPKRFKGFVDRFIPLEEFQVTGVVYQSGKAVGQDGYFCRSRMFDGARAARMQVMEIRRLAEGHPFAAMEEALRSAAPMVRGHDSLAVHLWIQAAVLEEGKDGTNRLRKDYVTILDQVIKRLGEF